MQTHDRGIAAPLPDCDRRDYVRFSLLLLQLGGIAAVVHLFQIESTAFFQLMLLTVAGFGIHYLLPFRHRLPFFLVLSISGIVLVLGVVSAAWVVGLGLLLIGFAHLPIPIVWRAGVLVLSCVAMFLIRTRLEAPWSAAVWPILASMFMFRMIVYMYDQSTGQGQAPLSQRLSYFFLLPNVCFPLFPVVDFRTFVRNYYNAPRHEIHQVGIEWMIRGLVQLLLYRVVQLWFAISPYDIGSAITLAHYFVWLYLLYLLVSGQFHLIVGMLLLFGFNLPETHKRYYLASSFSDFWRRINIYWKDFMMKVFYYPTFFRLRRLGPTSALVLSTVIVFVMTWGLHAYQSFWIRGFFHFTWNDTLFWAILCGLVVANSLYEARYGRRRALSRQTQHWRSQAVVVLKTAATFTAICLLWSFWSSESVGSWLSLWAAVAEPPTRREVQVLLGIAAALVAAVVLGFARNRWSVRQPGSGLALRSAVGLAWVALLAALSLPAVQGVLGTPGTIVASIQRPRLNAFQLEELERGYYEDLLVVDRFNRELGALYAKRPSEWETKLAELGVHDLQAPPGEHIKPNVAVPYKGTVFRSNQWGMHDRDYALEAPAGTYRIALLGASHVMAIGVERHQTFEALLEERLNREAAGAAAARYEILNFAFNNFSAFEHIHLLQSKVPAFEPDAVWYVGHPYEGKRLVRRIRELVQNPDPGVRRGYPWLDALARRADVNHETSEYLAERRLTRVAEEIVLNLFGTIVDLCRTHGMRPVYVHMPLTPESRNEIDRTPYVELARRAGFATVDLTGVYDGYGRNQVWVAEWDAHPNQLGHRLVAERLHQLIQQEKHAIFGTNEHLPQRARPRDPQSPVKASFEGSSETALASGRR